MVLAGLPRERAEREAEAFASAEVPRVLRGRGLETLAAHRRRGDRLVLLSASPDLYVRHIALRLGFDEVISTELRWESDRYLGELASANRRGPEKRRCLEALRAHHPGARFAAYGNAASDLEHLATVEEPWLVNANAAARAEARELGIPTADWP
jgi:phosphatidylglycerophosphatase C